MTISKKLGLGLALATLGSLLAVACNDSTSSSCTAACNHVLNCTYAALVDAGLGAYVTDAGTYCQDACAPDGGFSGGTCKNPAAGYDCVNGLSCADIIGNGDGPGPALQSCQDKAECDAG